LAGPKTSITVEVFVGVLTQQTEKSNSPPTYEGWNKSPSIYENEFFTSQQDKSPPEAVLKNHIKSQKNHKMKNQIVLDFKLVVLRIEHII
jgi:hypothetical protein